MIFNVFTATQSSDSWDIKLLFVRWSSGEKMSLLLMNVIFLVRKGVHLQLQCFLANQQKQSRQSQQLAKFLFCVNCSYIGSSCFNKLLINKISITLGRYTPTFILARNSDPICSVFYLRFVFNTPRTVQCEKRSPKWTWSATRMCILLWILFV